MRRVAAPAPGGLLEGKPNIVQCSAEPRTGPKWGVLPWPLKTVGPSSGTESGSDMKHDVAPTGSLDAALVGCNSIVDCRDTDR